MPPTNGTKRLARTRPGRLDEPLELTASRRRMLELLHRYRYLTSRLLGVAYSGQDGRGLKQVQNELGRLYHHGYVERHYQATRPAGSGSDEYIYTLSKLGAQAVLDPREYSEARHGIYNRERQKSNYPHHLAISTLQLVLELGCQPWEIAAFSSDHEDVGSKAMVQLPGRPQPTGIWPDAEAVVRFANGQRTLYLFEIDRAHRNSQRFDTRFLAYATHLRENLETLKTKYEVNGVVAVFVAPDQGALLRLIERAHGLFQREIRPPRPLFLFWNRETWYAERSIARERNGAQWTATERILKAPREILEEETVINITGHQRRLVQS